MNDNFFMKKDNPKSAPVTIIEDSGIFYKMSNGDMVLKSTFSMLYEPINLTNENFNSNNSTKDINGDVDPKSFFNSTKFGQVFQPEHDNKYVDRNNMNPNTPNNMVQQPQQPVEVTKIDNTQNVIEDELYNDEIAVYGIEEANKRRRNRMKGISNSTSSVQNSSQSQQVANNNYNNLSPSEMMFKTFKRSHEIMIKLEFKQMIGQPDFVRMMLENIDGDIVEYYKNIIMDDIMSQVSRIEQEVSEQIKNEIFGDRKKKSKKTSHDTKNTAVDNITNVNLDSNTDKDDDVVLDNKKDVGVVQLENNELPLSNVVDNNVKPKKVKGSTKTTKTTKTPKNKN